MLQSLVIIKKKLYFPIYQQPFAKRWRIDFTKNLLNTIKFLIRFLESYLHLFRFFVGSFVVKNIIKFYYNIICCVAVEVNDLSILFH